MKNNALILAVTSTLVLFLLTSIALARPIVIVVGSEDHQQIKKQAAAYLDHLDIQENIHLTIIISPNLPKTLHGLTHSLPLKLAETNLFNPAEMNQVIQVWIDAKLSKENQLLVLAHEMIHVKQFAKKELIVQEDRVIWKGLTYYNYGDYDRHTPWEKEAYYTDRKLAQLVPRQEDKNNILEARGKLTIPTPAGNEEYLKIKPDTTAKNLIACSKKSCQF